MNEKPDEDFQTEKSKHDQFFKDLKYVRKDESPITKEILQSLQNRLNVLVEEIARAKTVPVSRNPR